MKKALSYAGIVLSAIFVLYTGAAYYLAPRTVESQTPVLVNDQWVENYGSRVYKITSTSSDRSGGTGFAVVAKSGRTVIVTNHHICALRDANDLLAIHTEDGITAVSKIMFDSPTEDLCVVEGLPGVTGLVTANFAEPTTYIIILGHPFLEPLTASAGILEDYGLITIGEIKKDDCNQFGEKVEVIKMMGFIPIEICTKRQLGIGLSARTYPGNSGSPVLNIQGEVVAVVFAGNPRTAEGFAMTLYALRDQLDRF